MTRYNIAILLLFIAGCKTADKIEQSTQQVYSEPHRPQFHFSPKAKWMNDPNGMVFLDGEYHLFYQHYPDDDVWGPMHWGHAVSKDLVHWEHLPIALYPDSLGMIFSGSAVLDKNNTSGLGTFENPPLVAIFTYHKMEAEKAGKIDYQTQGMAFSLDKGRTWTKYKNNPIVKNPGIKDFRDPKVFWHEDSKRWLMILAVLDHVEFYNSSDLKSWNKLSDFGKDYGSHGGVWECPDLFELEVPDENKKKWVMLLSINPGGPNGGSGTQYFLGNFDGKNFTSDTPKNDTLWIDYGPDDYAGVTWSNIPAQDGRRLFLGWMSNWNYANVVPTSPWRSAMTIPRELALAKINDEIRLTSSPVKEMDLIVGRTKTFNSISLTDTFVLERQLDFPLSTFALEGAINAKMFTIQLSNDAGENLKFGFDKNSNRFFIDRGNAGDAPFSKNFNAISYSSRISKNEKVNFKIYVDVASVELFFDDGLNTMTGIFFPKEKFSHAKIYGPDPLTLDTLEVKELNRTW
jgi:fructan beta-fructosidase